MIGSSRVNYPWSSTRSKTSSGSTFLSKRGTRRRSLLSGLELEELRVLLTRYRNLITDCRSMRRRMYITSNSSMCKTGRTTNEIPTCLLEMAILITIRAMRTSTSASAPITTTITTTETTTTTTGVTIPPTSNGLSLSN